MEHASPTLEHMVDAVYIYTVLLQAIGDTATWFGHNPKQCLCTVQKQQQEAEMASMQAQLVVLHAAISEKEAQLQPVQAKHMHLQVRCSRLLCVPIPSLVSCIKAQSLVLYCLYCVFCLLVFHASCSLLLFGIRV